MVFDGLRRQVEDLRTLLGDRDYLVAWRFEQALTYARSAFTAYLESEAEDPFDDTTIALSEKTQQKVARVTDAIPLLSAAPEKVADS